MNSIHSMILIICGGILPFFPLMAQDQAEGSSSGLALQEEALVIEGTEVTRGEVVASFTEFMSGCERMPEIFAPALPIDDEIPSQNEAQDEKATAIGGFFFEFLKYLHGQ